MTVLTVIDVVAAVAIIAWRAAIAAGNRWSTVDNADPPPADSSVDRAKATIGWAEGTRADWDRHVRPVLARELTEVLRARRVPGETPIGQRVLGAELWPLVDPSHPFTADLARPGPGRDGLARILDQLERLWNCRHPRRPPSPALCWTRSSAPWSANGTRSS
jgi:hypothetical protein